MRFSSQFTGITHDFNAKDELYSRRDDSGRKPSAGSP